MQNHDYQIKAREERDAKIAQEALYNPVTPDISIKPIKKANQCPVCGGPVKGRGYTHTEQCSTKKKNII
jgi:ribosomal protein L13E